MADANYIAEPTRPAGVNTAHLGAEQFPKAGTIRFHAHHSGTLETSTGIPSLSFLPAIFALANTRKAYDCTIGGEPFQTDAAGLKWLEEIAEQAEDSIGDAVETIGTLLANADADTVGADVFNRAGWLLVGLSELRRVVASTRSDAGHHLTTGRYAVTGGDHA